MKVTTAKGFWIGLAIVIQTVVYIVAGMGKAYIHMDEAYSLGLANYDQVEIQENADFYNQWHDGAYYRDYLVVDADERGDFSPVYANQRDDVHPPLFYLLLRLGMELTPGEFSKWTGLALNMIYFAVNTVFLYLIVERLLKGEQARLAKAFGLTLAASITLAAISTVVYIRMYALLAMWVTMTVYLHMRLLESKKPRAGLLVATGVVALLGVLTQYYYVFALAPLFVVMVVKYGRARRWAELKWYVGTLALAAVVSLAVWPYAIQHLFFGYRGQGALGNLLNFTQLGKQMGIFLGLVTMYDFHYALPVILVAMFGLAVWGLRHGKRLEVQKERDNDWALVLWPTLFFLLIASVASPFTDLRYLEAICGLLFVAVMLGLYWLVGLFASERGRNITMAAVLGVMAMLPVPLKLEPDVEYSRFGEIVELVEANHEVPALYLFDMNNNRFLDDILLFTKLDESYVANEPEDYTVTGFKRMLAGKDLKQGLLVFSNYGYGKENEAYLEILREAAGLDEQEYVFRLNAGAVYWLR